MAVITVVVLAQKLLTATAAFDMPLALAIIGLGILITFARSAQVILARGSAPRVPPARGRRRRRQLRRLRCPRRRR